MREKILEYLRKKDGYVSGDQISQRLGITRQALWKHIQELKNLGYEITAVPHLGYRLQSSADRLFDFEVAHNLDTKFIGKKIHYFNSIESTMDTAMQLGIKGAQKGTLVLAESQTRGRGRLARSWFSPRNKGIYLSLILRPDITPVQAPLLTLLAAVSICEAIKEATGLDACIKWPNDILINHKKIGGILTEINAEIDKINFVVLGIGINVNNELKTLPEKATSLREEKREWINRIELLQGLLRRIESNYLDFEHRGARDILKKWQEYNITLGRRIKIHRGRDSLEGQAVDIDEDGGLLLRKDSGVVEKVMAGDVMHCR